MRLLFCLLSLTLFSANESLSLVNGAGGLTDMSLEDGLKFLQIGEIHKLEEKVKALKAEMKDLAEEQEKEIADIKSQHEETTKFLQKQVDDEKQAVTNQRIRYQFMKDILYFNEGKKSTCKETVEVQAEQLEILEAERKEYQKKNDINLKQAYLQEDIIKSQELEMELLTKTIETQKDLYDDYDKMNKFDIANNMHEFPSYAQLLTKTMADQADKIKQMSDYFEEEKKVEENMGQILKEIQNIDFDMATQQSKGDLLKQYKDLLSLQDANLKAVGPALTYVKQNNERYVYNLNTEGVLLGLDLCQCIPDTGDSGVVVTDIEFSCPAGMVSPTTLEESLLLPCPGGDCPEAVAEDTQCGDYNALPWSAWEDCTSAKCLVDSVRSRKVRVNGTIDYESQTNGSQPLIIKTSEQFDIALPEGGILGVFVVGGGGGADDVESGSSGFFKYIEIPIVSGKKYPIDIEIGRGGDNADGTPTVVTIEGLDTVKALGGGYSGNAGWSGGSSEKGGENGSNGDSMYNGSGETLPVICHPGVTLEPGSTGNYGSDGTGGGGVIVDGDQPMHRYTRDGFGYGAGGGEDDYDGYDGIAVLVLCP